MTIAVLTCLLLQTPLPAILSDGHSTTFVQKTMLAVSSPKEEEANSGDPASTSLSLRPEPLVPAPTGQDSPQDSIVVTAMRDNVPGDPLQSVNIRSFALTHSIDKAVFRPVALAYRHGLPSPVRSGLRNILTNLNEPVVSGAASSWEGGRDTRALHDQFDHRRGRLV